jgi:hypothetical protein
MYRYNQHSFVGGQLDRGLMGRQDLERYFQGASKLENFIVRKQGNITKRRGSEMIADMGDLFGTGDAIAYSRLIPLARDISAGYYILFAESAAGESGAFVIGDSGLLHSKTVTKSLEGRDDVVSNSQEWLKSCARSTEETTEEIAAEDGTAETWSVSTVIEPFRIDIPYAGQEFDEIGFNQSGDTVFLTHKNHPPAKVTNLHQNFNYSILDFIGSRWHRPAILSITPKGFKGSGSSKTVQYVCTYVKDGIESMPSEIFSASYALPWNSEALMEIVCDKGANTEEPDYYNIYKKDSSEFGLISTIGSAGSVNAEFSVANGTAIAPIRRYSFVSEHTDIYGRSAKETYGWDDKIFLGTFLVSSYPLANVVGGIEVPDGKVIFDFGDAVRTKITRFEIQLDAFYSYNTISRTGKNNRKLKHRYYRVGTATHFKATFFIDDNGTEITFSQEINVAQQDFGDPAYDGGTYQTGLYITNPNIEQYNRTAAFDFLKDITNNSTLKSSQIWQIKKITVDFYDAAGNLVPAYFHGVRFFNSLRQSNIIEDDYITPNMSLTPPQQSDMFSSVGDYPSCVAMYTQRLAFAATQNQPFTWWMSCVGDLYNFSTHAAIRQDDAMEVTVPATEFPNINHMVLLRDLVLFCDNGEWVVRPLSGNTIAYDTVECKKQSAIGCSKSTPPIQVGDEIIFTDNSRRVIRSIKYQFTSDGYESSDLSILSQSLFFSNPVISMCYKQHPESLILCELSDGTVAALVYMKEHNVVAWTHHTLGGGWKCRGIASNKAHADETTHVAMLVEHPDGGTEIWRIRDDDESADFSAQLCMDGLRFALGSEIGETAFTGGQAVYDLTTGEPVESAADLKPDGEYAVGYPFSSTFVSVRPEPQGNETFQWELKNAKLAHIRTLNGSSFTVKDAGLSDGYASPVDIDRSVTDGEITVPGLVDATDILLNGENSRDGRIEIRHDGILPLTIESFSVDYETQPLYGSEG